MTTTSAPRRWPRALAALLVAIVALAAAGLLLLDRLLLSRARAEAAELSRTWGRPVEIDGLSTKLVPWLGLWVNGLRIGAAAGEPKPLLELDRVEVHLNLLGALLSRGKDVDVQLAEVQGLRVNVLRLPDGSTNLERLAQAAAPKGAPEPEAKEPPADLSFLRVTQASLSGGRVAFLDLGRPGAKELAVDRIDVSVHDLRVGRPLDVVLRAAVLAGRQNLEFHLHAAPLPPTLVPTPDEVALKLAPVDLDPLAPFLPAKVGFLGGRLEADLEADLGSAVPGGSGPSKIRGGFAARGLRFAGQEGGKPLDVLLDADLDGDVGKGQVRIGKLLLTAGPATLTGSGRASGLGGDAPRIDGLRLTGRGLDPKALAAYYPPLRKALGDMLAGPIGFELQATGDAGAPALEARVDLTPVRLSLPGTLAKAPGAPLLAIARTSFTYGTTHLTAHLDLAGVDLRPGGSIAKAPGDRLALDVNLDLAQGGAERTLELKRLDLLLPADAITARGTASIAQAGKSRAVRFDLTAESARLDLDRLLLPSPPPQKAKKAPAAPDAYAGLSGTAKVTVTELRYAKATFKNVRARIKLDGDDLRVEEARLEGLGGVVSADGTRMRLAHPQEPAHVTLKLDGVDAGEVLAMYTPHKLLAGKVSADVDLTAGGAAGRDLLASLSGSLGGKIFDGAFLSKDLVSGVAGPLVKALPFAVTQKVADGGSTPLGKELPFDLKVADGAMKLAKPLRVDHPRAALAVEGGQVKLDGTLDLPLTVKLSPDTIASITGGRARPPDPIPVSLRVTGPAWDPHLGDLALQPAVAAIAKTAAQGAASKAVDNAKKKAGDKAKSVLKGLFGR
jgi:AsmA protein